MRVGGERRRARGGAAPWIVALVSLCVACERDDAPPTAGELLPEGVEMAQTAMRTTVTREGVRRAFVEGDTAEWRGEHEVHLRPMRIFFYDANGNPASEVTSDFGIYNELTGDLEAEGGVVAEDYVDGQRLETERMRYVNADGRLHGPVAFNLSRAVGTMVIEGTAFESDPGLDSVIVLNPEGETRPRLVTVSDFPAEDSAAAPSDSVAVQDTAAAAQDTTVVQDAAAAAPDTTVAQDTAASAPDPTVAQDTAASAPDPAAVRDTLVAPPDTAVVQDTAAAPADTTAAQDTLVAPPDTTDAGDSTVVPPDTTVARDTTGAPPDTTVRR